MTVLAAVFVLGLGLSLLPWKPVAVGVVGAVAVWFAVLMVGPPHPLVPLAMLLAPALLLGWAAGLLIRRTIAERRAA